MSTLLDDSLVIVLAGGAGERLYPLTKDRAKPAVYFGGPYRIIDFSLSNCINSGLRRIFIATQYKSLSLNRHIRMGWGIVSEELGEFVEILPPQKRVSEHWYQGTADAVYQNLYSIMRENPRHLVVLSGDHVYKMDYSRMLRLHQERGAAVTLATIEVPVTASGRFGIIAIDETERVTGFEEQPKAATSARSMPISRRTWISARSIRSSTCTIRSGRCARTSRRRRRRSSCSPSRAAAAGRRSTR